MTTQHGVSQGVCHRVENLLGSLPEYEQCAVRKIYRTYGYVRAIAVVSYLRTHQAKERRVIHLSKLVGEN